MLRQVCALPLNINNTTTYACLPACLYESKLWCCCLGACSVSSRPGHCTRSSTHTTHTTVHAQQCLSLWLILYDVILSQARMIYQDQGLESNQPTIASLW